MGNKGKRAGFSCPRAGCSPASILTCSHGGASPHATAGLLTVRKCCCFGYVALTCVGNLLLPKGSLGVCGCSVGLLQAGGVRHSPCCVVLRLLAWTTFAKCVGGKSVCVGGKSVCVFVSVLSPFYPPSLHPSLHPSFPPSLSPFFPSSLPLLLVLFYFLSLSSVYISPLTFLPTSHPSSLFCSLPCAPSEIPKSPQGKVLSVTAHLRFSVCHHSMAGPQNSPAAAPVRPGDHGCSFLLVHATVATTVEWWWYGEKGPRWVRSTDNAEGHCLALSPHKKEPLGRT